MNDRGVQVGDRIRDNDPRYPSRELVVTGFDQARTWNGRTYAMRPAVLAKGEGKRVSRIRLDRIYTDGKPRATGWSLVTS